MARRTTAGSVGLLGGTRGGSAAIARAAAGCACIAALTVVLTAPAAVADDAPPPSPPAPAPAYWLPWTAGELYVCVQGNHGLVSHNGRQAYAFDFAMPEGTPVRASRAGVVVEVVDHHTRRGTDAPNNKVAIDHGDGTRGWYLHIRTGGARVAVGQRVERGQVVAESGNVGKSALPHLHFHVTGPDKATIPIRFQEVSANDGVPRTLGRYASANQPADAPPPGAPAPPTPAPTPDAPTPAAPTRPKAPAPPGSGPTR